MVFCFLSLVAPPGGSGGGERPAAECLTSLYLDEWSSKLTCYPCAEVVRHKLLYAIWSSKGGTE